MKCEKCGVEVLVTTATAKLLGGHMAELCLPCQRAWNRLVTESPEFLELNRDRFRRELLLAQVHGRDLDDRDVVKKILAWERYFMVISEKWLAEKPKAAPPKLISQAECVRLNAYQNRRDVHPYTCGNDSNHEPLFATRDGWTCLQCNYHQPYGDELTIVELPPKAEDLNI